MTVLARSSVEELQHVGDDSVSLGTLLRERSTESLAHFIRRDVRQHGIASFFPASLNEPVHDLITPPSKFLGVTCYQRFVAHAVRFYATALADQDHTILDYS